jgi:hypothetical protein
VVRIEPREKGKLLLAYNHELKRKITLSHNINKTLIFLGADLDRRQLV